MRSTRTRRHPITTADLTSPPRGEHNQRQPRSQTQPGHGGGSRDTRVRCNPHPRLTPRQERFVAEYLVDLNATQAAIRAGYSPKTASAIGAENLRKPQLAAAVRVAARERAAATEITAANVLRRLASIGFNDDATHTEQTRALELLGRHLALFTDRIEHSGTVEFHHLDQIDTAIAELTRQLEASGVVD